MASVIANVIKSGTRVLIRRNRVQSKEALVKHLRRAFAPPPVSFIPRSVTVTRQHIGNMRVDHLAVDGPREVILYLHGGGYVAGDPKTYHSLCAGLAKTLHADVYLPKYRLAPEHAFPAPVEDALAAYEYILARFHPSKITVAGDSAGGGLTLALLLAARDKGLPPPKCAVVFSPFADVTRGAKSHHRNNDTDAMLSSAMLGIADDIYVRDPRELKHPYASPAFGDYHGLPPLLITVCEEECLRDDSYAVAQRAREANVPVTFISRQDLFHVWPVMYPLLPEAREDFQKVVAFIRQH